MKITKDDLLALDELTKMSGYKILKVIIEDKKRLILKQLENIKSYEKIDKEGVKVIYTADNQLNEIRGKLKAYNFITNLIDTSYKKSKEVE